jgi:hypothetical protein
MNLWFFLTIVAIVAIVSEVFKEYVKVRGSAVTDKLRELETEVTHLREQVAEAKDLRQRVEVLEDIVTSADYEVERQFARLGSEEQTQTQSVTQ